MDPDLVREQREAERESLAAARQPGGAGCETGARPAQELPPAARHVLPMAKPRGSFLARVLHFLALK
jgi:hypothetical protein